MSIPNFINKIKGKINIDKFTFLYLIIIISVGISSFFLGRISSDIKEGEREGELLISGNDKGIQGIDSSNEISTESQIEKRYVASKNGKMYYSLGCSGAKRIKPENEVWFSTKEEAEKSGYSLSSLCK